MVTLEWLGTAGFRVSGNSASFLIDPYLSRNRNACPNQPRQPADLRGKSPIFLSHGHFDHALDLAEIVTGTEAATHGSATALASLLRAGVPTNQLRTVSDGEMLDFAGFQAQAFHSRHVQFDLPLIVRTLRRAGWEILQAMNLALRYPAGQVMSWRFTVDGVTLHHFASAGSTKRELERLSGAQTDILLAPLQGHSRIQDIALRYVEYLRPQVVIPHHHDDFYPPLSEMVEVEPFVSRVRDRYPHIQVIEPVINRPFDPLLQT